jgi:hypothetical protein
VIALTWVIDMPLATNMAAIRDTAESTGASLEASPGLLTGITAMTVAGQGESTRNTVAMLTVWANTSRMAEFLWGDATAEVEKRLARPTAHIWPVSSVQLDRSRFPNITHAGLHIMPRMTYNPISSLVKQQRTATQKAAAGRSTALACRGLDPKTWEDVSIDAWIGHPRAYDGRVFEVVQAIANPANNHP